MKICFQFTLYSDDEQIKRKKIRRMKHKRLNVDYVLKFRSFQIPNCSILIILGADYDSLNKYYNFSLLIWKYRKLNKIKTRVKNYSYDVKTRVKNNKLYFFSWFLSKYRVNFFLLFVNFAQKSSFSSNFFKHPHKREVPH